MSSETCPFCGTRINPGANTCTGCRAYIMWHPKFSPLYVMCLIAFVMGSIGYMPMCIAAFFIKPEQGDAVTYYAIGSGGFAVWTILAIILRKWRNYIKSLGSYHWTRWH